MHHLTHPSGDTPALVAFFRQHLFPFCKAVDSLATLRTGIAIAEVLTDKLPSAYHPLFLPHIEIYHPSPQRALMNLRVILGTLRAYYGQHPQLGVVLEDFNAEGLYFDHNMMETFIFTAVMPLHAAQQQTPNDQALRQAYLAVEEISDIANLSSIMIPDHKHPDYSEQQPNRPSASSCLQRASGVEREELRLEKIEEWLREVHHIEARELTPEQIMGELVNSMFAGSRLDNGKIIKESHYHLGSVTVFKKVCNYLLTCERMPKQKVLTLFDQVQDGTIREQLFWGVIQDMMNIRISLHSKMLIKTRSSRKQITKSSLDKQNTVPTNHNVPAPQQPIKVRQPQLYKTNNESLKKAEEWIAKELGYEHSLNKSKTSTNLSENPLLNGILLGSIVMRMQLGKVNINKQPTSKKQIDKNIAEVVNCIIRRGIQAGRKFTQFTPTYNTYLGLIWEVHQEWQLKSQLEKTRRIEMARQKRQPNKDLAEEERGLLAEWLESRGFELKSLDYLPAEIVSEVCGELLQLRLLRETTKRIKETNMVKVLDELRRLGWRQECSVAQVLQQASSPLRWQILRFAKQILTQNVYYYR